jgi:hypothetical protein
MGLFSCLGLPTGSIQLIDSGPSVQNVLLCFDGLDSRFDELYHSIILTTPSNNYCVVCRRITAVGYSRLENVTCIPYIVKRVFACYPFCHKEVFKSTVDGIHPPGFPIPWHQLPQKTMLTPTEPIPTSYAIS